MLQWLAIYCIGTSYTTKDVFIHSSYHCNCEKPVPFPGLYMREFELSDCNLINRIIKITHANNLHMKMLDFGLLQFVRKLFTRKFSQTILKNQLGFITTSAIKLCFMQRQGWYSLTFINFQENYQIVKIYFYSYHVIPLYKTICKIILSTSIFEI